ncbi:MAG: arsenate reductase (glutaredoxin) [SAR324 cluster bacterium]|nr:arsenate reductase (glutaredoxin) [SAR324 cluster bacterium]
MTTTIYHNPKCSKSRATLQILEEKNVELTIINYLDAPPSQADLKRILQLLDKKPQEIIRFKEKEARDLNLSAEDDRDLEGWLELMISHPILIERPIVVSGDKAVMGRPPENVLSLI